jgi:thiol-disulfide isomerase/thioredoxin
MAILALVAGLWANSSLKSDFSTLSGDSYQWRDFDDQWVVVNYFAEWCAPCLKEIPELNAFSEFALGHQDLALFGISYDQVNAQQLTELRDKYGISFELIKNVTGEMPNTKPKNLPATFLIAPNGEVFRQLLGEQTNLQLQQKWLAAKQIYARN